MDHLKAKIRHVPDFPKPGILFYDITTLLCDPQGFRDTIDALAAPYMGEDIDQVVGIESRGFILGAAVADDARLRLRADPQARQAAGRDATRRATTSSTAPTRSRFTRTRAPTTSAS